MRRTTTVRTAVAVVDGTPETPIFARIVVAAAAIAARNAQKNQVMAAA
jgi:hypothetical protein